ncbi:MAG: hypothetical protein V4719_02865 [Planctomycetota bacterium]
MSLVSAQPESTGDISQNQASISSSVNNQSSELALRLISVPNAIVPYPPPVGSPLSEPRSDGIQVLISEFLLDLGGRIDVKAIGFRLPEPGSEHKFLKVVGRVFGVPSANLEAAHALSALNEPPQILPIGQPEQSV